MKQNKIIPKFRFPEFENEEEWEEKTLAKVATFLKGKSISKADISKDGKLACIRYGELYTTYDEVINEVVSSTNLPPETLVLSEANDVIIPASGETQIDIAKASCVNLNNIALGGDLNIIRSSLNGIFLSYYLNHPLKHNIAKLAQGNAVVHLYIDQLKSLNLYIPQNKEEQQKIADCLSSLDEVIAQHEEKRLSLEEHKKGLMQNLFPQEGETKPKYRFPEFENEGDWKERKLEELARYENGKAHEQDILEDGEYIVVNAKFIATNGQVKKYSDTATCLANKKDILMALSDLPNGRALGKCFYVDEENRYTVNQRICKLSSKIINPFLLYYLLDRNAYFLSFNDGVKQTNLKKDDVLNCPVVFPQNKEEQQKIADCLSSVDNLIRETAVRVEELKQHKQGLMQALFPKMKR